MAQSALPSGILEGHISREFFEGSPLRKGSRVFEHLVYNFMYTTLIKFKGGYCREVNTLRLWLLRFVNLSLWVRQRLCNKVFSKLYCQIRFKTYSEHCKLGVHNSVNKTFFADLE